VGMVSARWGNRRLVMAGLILATAGALVFAMPFLPYAVQVLGLLLMGLGLAPVYPSLMHETPRRFAPALARTVIGRQVACAALGAALGPAALGVLGAWAGLVVVMPAVLLALLTLLLLSRWLDSLS
jgi:MFS family permease